MDIPAPGTTGTFEGILSCMGKGRETLFRSSFIQAGPLTAIGNLGVALRPLPRAGGQPLPAGEFGPDASRDVEPHPLSRR
ncbi:MAG: hypothetical protein MZU79_04390 [Anaerotruncus sp.]|nr:hypothetical protein [Anaerotruncus sp.]